MELSDILAEDAVLSCTGLRSKDEVFDAIAQRAAAVLGQDQANIRAALEAREALGSTGLGDGIAIPHGKLPGISRVTAFLVRLDHAIDFGAIDDRPVDIVVALFAPLGAGADHLKALSRVARALRSDATVNALRNARDASALHAVMTSAQAAHKAA